MKIEWTPPHTPHMLLQEGYWPDRWKVAVICMMLNCTSRKQVEPILESFFAKFPTPQALIGAHHNTIAASIKSLGFKNRRTKALRRFSKDFIAGEWSSLRECHGIGEYADACDRMYFEMDFDETPPKDGALVKVWNWIVNESQAV